jgi:O-antigen biosynthesis protein
VDYLFTGNFWQHPRDFMTQLRPQSPELAAYRGWVVGAGWPAALEQGLLAPGVEAMLRPPVPYPRLPELYTAASVVLDDSNHVTKAWGSVNSRVFDALAAGVLVVTNGRIGRTYSVTACPVL